MKQKSIISIIILAVILSACQTEKPSLLSIDEFKNPGTEYRPLALWSWMNGYIDTAKLVYELEQMKAKGMRGGIIWDLGAISDPDKMIPAGPPFLGPESLEYLSIAMKKGDELGLDIGMAISSSWNAGGEWIGPENAIKQVLMSNAIVDGSGKKTIKITPPSNRNGAIENYTWISTIAMPYTQDHFIDEAINQSIDLSKNTSDGETVIWEVPDGEWEVFSFFSCNTMQPLVIPSPNSKGLMIDHLSYDATKSHFDTLFSRLPDDLLENELIKFMEIDSYEVNPMKDWSPNLVSEFKSRYNYDPIPYIPLLLGYNMKDSIRADRFRADYSLLVSDMMVDNHFSQSVEIANKYDIQMVTEAGHGGFPRVDALKALGHSHIPTGEFWNRQRFWVTKEAASAAHIYDLKLVASESLTGWQHWQHGPSDYKQLIDIALCEGLNQIMFHTFAHNPEIAGKPGFTYHAGEHLNVNTTWWSMAKPFMDYIGRCSYLLRQGLFVADACLYYGDQAPNLVPSKRIDPNIKAIFDDTQCLHCGKPKPINPGSAPGYDWDYMNAEIITRDLKVVDGRLVLPSGMSYRVMMLPDKEAINLDVLRSIEKLVAEGAVILGRKPIRTSSLMEYPSCDPEVKALADKLWGACNGKDIFVNSYGQGQVYWGKTLEEVLVDLGVGPDFEVKGIDNCDMHIDYIHRRTDQEDIYFISNSNQTPEKFSVVFRVDKNMKPEIWDPLSASIQRDIEFTKAENGIEMEFILEPLASRFIIFKSGKKGKNDMDLITNLQFAGNTDIKGIEDDHTIDLSSDWTISFDQNMGAPASFDINKLMSWSDISLEGISYYSGSAFYEKSFSFDKSALSDQSKSILKFDKIQETAKIMVNGQDCGIVWTPPYELDITEQLKDGANNISIEVINTWNNRLVGDMRNPDQKQYTNTNIKDKFKNKELLESGLIGNIRIINR